MKFRTRKRGLAAAQTIGQAVDAALVAINTQVRRAAVGIAVTAFSIGLAAGIVLAVGIMLTSPHGVAR